ncbi:MAG TPA: hypothetical protein VK172_14865 [Lentimicrobium sp.]|nr:hypothetical protein [Bacteroidales bacterium]HLO92444.1 hypothetical protein [Lentimicrobium sp.]
MKRVLSYLLMVVSLSINAETYYVSTTGNDNDNGDITHPWATWQKAFNSAQAGDTVYFRGGIWYPDATLPAPYASQITLIDPTTSHGHSGTYTNPICYFNYPGETPILDCRNVVPVSNWNTGISIYNAEHIKFRGLTVRNVYQTRNYVECGGIGADACANLSFENMSVYNISGYGYKDARNQRYSYTYDSTYFVNCDAYNCLDSLPYNSNHTSGGNLADGFKTYNDTTNHGTCIYYLFQGCRAWNCSDDGFDPSSDGKVVIENCWSFLNGQVDPVVFSERGGNGFKTGGMWQDNGTEVTRIVRNNLAAFNLEDGFFMLEYVDYWRTNGRIYNNTSYKNDYGFANSSNALHPTVLNLYQNNIAYQNISGPVLMPYMDIPESHNTWDGINSFNGYSSTDTVTVTDADFALVDSAQGVAQLMASRKSDHSLPDITFLKLVESSDLIDAGTNVGLPYAGSAPDLGFNEYGLEEAPVIDTSRHLVKYTDDNLMSDGAGNFMVYGGTDTTIPDDTTTPPDPPAGGQIIADHNAVAAFDNIPQNWIDSVKTMWMCYAGESHALGLRTALFELSQTNSTYITYNSNPPAGPTPGYLRLSGRMYGDYSNATGWTESYGEEDWWDNSTAIERTKASLQYAHDQNLKLSAVGFGWCWDATAGNASSGTDATTGNHWYGWSEQGPSGDHAWGIDDADNSASGNSINMDDYLDATQQYINYCATHNIPTKVFFTTGPVDRGASQGSEAMYQGYLKYEHIRNYVLQDETRILFDFADILCYDNGSSTPYTVTWDGHTFPEITPTNLGSMDAGHIGSVGRARLAKAMWWMLARIAGWDGISN